MIDNNLMDDNYISIDDAAAYLGIKTVTLRNWIKKKPDIPAHRVGKLWKFKRSELDEWIASGKARSNHQYIRKEELRCLRSDYITRTV